MARLTTRDGCELDYQDTGTGGTPLVLLHGWSQSQAMFDRLRAELGGDRRVISFDARNHGASGRTDLGARVATLAADLREVLDHLGVDRCDVVGHSMGASVVWSFVDQHGTDRLRRVVLLDQPSVCTTMPWMSAEESAQAGAILDFPGAEGFVATLLGEGGPDARHAFLVSMLTPDLPPQDLAWMAEQNMLLPMPWGAKLLLDHVMQDWRDVLGRLDVPVLVVGGEVSHVAPASQEWIAAQVPDAQVLVVPRAEGGAHFPFFESPATFAKQLTAFLDG